MPDKDDISAKLEHSIEVKEATPTAPPAQPARPRILGIDVKYWVLPLLSLQNAGAVLLMRGTRSIEGHNEFSPQAAVIMQEFIKGFSCILILLWTEGTINSAWEVPHEALKTAIPAILYLVQNNFQYIAVGVLDVVTYTISGQTKILWTGLLTATLLGRTLQCNKWTGIFLLACGVSMVNLGGTGRTESQAVEVTNAQRLGGLFFILTAAACSSLAGVYFEKILKGCQVSLWTRNLQLAFYSVFTGFIGLYFSTKDRQIVLTHGFLYGFTHLTWVTVFMNAFGGLLVGTVIKYADAVLKDVSIGASICISALGSVMLYGYSLSPLVILGAALVSYSIFIYGGTVRNPAQCLVKEDQPDSK
eukprot:TRINITY_DN11732_c1_g3_i1.p1 TRINITY_DN11732_c1_g3~~TRINITY_DN11732_c1_g3_i1.p1  ORF type:complete len:381 (+),score=56.14 TRINITY_DN11732_c1_g3_i1:66-1145(+)